MPDTIDRSTEDALRAGLQRIGRALEATAREGTDARPTPLRPAAPVRPRPHAARWAVAALVLAALGLAAVALVGRPGPSATVQETSARPDLGGGQATTTARTEGTTATTATATATATVTPDAGGETPSVVDGDGEVRGTFSRQDLDLRDQRIQGRLLAAGELVDGVELPYEATVEEQEALLVVEAIPVTDADGALAGYLAGGFISLDDYPEALAAAQAVVRDIGEG